MGDNYNNDVDIASKYQVELNSKYSIFNKQGSSNGQNTTTQEVNAFIKQLKKEKESE